MRHVVWFSCGVPSAVTAMLVRQRFPDALVVRIWLGGEDPDNDRFADEIADWLGCEITMLKSDKYRDHWEVIEKTGWVNGVGGARCTGELKKTVRHKFQQADDVQYFGYTAEPREVKRAERFRANFPEVTSSFPLIEAGLTKGNCAGIVERVGIELPRRYKQGYNNNNCIGCVKGGRGYWNKTRIDNPDVFDRMAKLERTVGASCIKGVFLDELNPDEGSHKDLQISCDFVCENTVNALTPRPSPIKEEPRDEY